MPPAPGQQLPDYSRVNLFSRFVEMSLDKCLIGDPKPSQAEHNGNGQGNPVPFHQNFFSNEIAPMPAD